MDREGAQRSGTNGKILLNGLAFQTEQNALMCENLMDYFLDCRNFVEDVEPEEIEPQKLLDLS